MVPNPLRKENQHNMELPEQWKFLVATRFWASLITSASVVLIDPNFANQPWYVTLGKFLGLVAAQFIAVGTADRFADKNVDAARIMSDKTVIEANESIIK